MSYPLSNNSPNALDLATPAFVIDESQLRCSSAGLVNVLRSSGIHVLYALKALNVPEVIRITADYVDGFSASSLFEVELVQTCCGIGSPISLVSPILKEKDLDGILSKCNSIVLNSLTQLERFGCVIPREVQLGIRINPALSFVGDRRYDPCRPDSKLGVQLQRFANQLRIEPSRYSSVGGLHFHSNCDSDDLGELVATLRKVESALGDDLNRFRWLNVGGGYSFADETGLELLLNEIGRLRDVYGFDILVEPGASIVRQACTFVSTVEDIVDGGECPVAMLDLTVNHWPEVFEYQFEPDVDGHIDGGRFSYLLAGCSCLAGDVFGVYSFNDPLEIGSRLVFPNAGAYSIVKAHMFNGINLPNIYLLRESGDLELVRRFGCDDFVSRCGVDTSAIVGT